jgi:hypothetical protein
MSSQMTLWDTNDAISSPELQDGITLCNSPGGPKAAKSGRVVVRVSRTRALAKAKAIQTKEICGPRFSRSFASDALSASLASKLQTQLVMGGSIEYSQTWKKKITPAGRVYWAHTASARRISGKGFTGYPTPNHHRHGMMSSEKSLRRVLAKAKSKKASQVNLEDVVAIFGWCNPTVTDANQGVLPPRPHDTGIPLSQQVSGTEKHEGYQLNPNFTRWLMGFPVEWFNCGATATQLCRKSRRRL